MMETVKQFEDYLLHIHQAISTQANPLPDLSAIVQEYKTKTHDYGLKEFYEGESNFYEQRYEQALKHYLKARDLPQFHFYCYRASAFVSKNLGQIDKAVKFAQKAEAINPQDYFVKGLIREIESPDLLAAKPQMPSEPENNEGVLDQILDDGLNLSGEAPHTIGNSEQQKDDVMHEENLAIAQPLSPENPPSFSNLSFDIDFFLKNKMNDFDQKKIELVGNYLKQSQKSPKEDKFLKFFTDARCTQMESYENILSTESTEDFYCSAYLRWDNQGIVINPKGAFLKNFHEQGYHLSDIDYIIVTAESPEVSSEVKKIHRFNTFLNTYSSDIHVIHYYLNHYSHQELSRFLKPYYKQEKNTVQLLELFRDSPEVEKITLNDAIHLHYFPITKKDGFAPYQERDLLSSSLGLRLELKNSVTHESTLIGFLSSCIWSPLLAHHVGLCDVLIASFGNTTLEDLEKRKYNDHCLGYYGIYSLVEEIQPKLMFCMEFSARHGDLRLELMQKLRHDLEKAQGQVLSHTTAILPADEGLHLNLEELNIRCSLTNQWIDPNHTKIIKSSANFGSLKYLHPSCCL